MNLRISKLDAARRQLESAVLLYFNERDPVSIHVLAAGAYQILADLASRAGDSMLLDKSLFSVPPSDLARVARDAMRKPQNFFKHADQDAEAVLEFDPRLTGVVLIDAMAKYFQITGENPPMFEAFVKWFGLHYPEFFTNAPALAALLERARPHLGSMSRGEFLREYLQATASLRP